MGITNYFEKIKEIVRMLNSMNKIGFISSWEVDD
nr:MAG TPA: hypothetical protein [Caudoviricetes sp.]